MPSASQRLFWIILNIYRWEWRFSLMTIGFPTPLIIRILIQCGWYFIVQWLLQLILIEWKKGIWFRKIMFSYTTLAFLGEYIRLWWIDQYTAYCFTEKIRSLHRLVVSANFFPQKSFWSHMVSTNFIRSFLLSMLNTMHCMSE